MNGPQIHPLIENPMVLEALDDGVEGFLVPPADPKEGSGDVEYYKPQLW